MEELESALDDEKRKKDACEQQIQQHLQVREREIFLASINQFKEPTH